MCRRPLQLSIAALLLGAAAAAHASQRESLATHAESPHRADLSVSAVAGNRHSEEGTEVVFEAIIVNRGRDDAADVLLEAIVEKRLEASLLKRRFESTHGARCYPDTLVCRIPRIRPNDRIRVVLSVRLDRKERLPSFGIEFRVTSKTIDAMPFDNRYYSSIYLLGLDGDRQRRVNPQRR